ncbi:hypothetical protein D9619_000106 [Psilocybe cf. subviscida]|uniref:Cytochrome P450 n=1 Tax=Psilocybe cf. subviscida TaxID=2480587 RepID=A0A8H5BF58_9AGAR|nr:hypothetical protein D9619_000106 [Psilocybe cf. subviscida]
MVSLLGSLAGTDSHTTILLGGLTTAALLYVLFFRRTKLDHIPTLGYSSPLLSYISASKFRTQSKELVDEGYRKFPGQVWKLSTFDRWYVIANGLERVHEIGRAPEEDLSGIISFEGYLQLDHTLGPEVTTNPYHLQVVRTTMTRNIGAQFADMRDEAIKAFEEIIPPSSTGWVAVPIFPAVTEVLSRISARLAVGAPLCENQHFRFLCGHSGDVIMRGRALRFFPKFLKPIASKYLVDIEADLKPLARYLEPVINERLQYQRRYGRNSEKEWEDKPNDTLMWLMEECQKSGAQVTPYEMATRLYFLTFASDGIATMLQCALYEICTRPEYVQPLRDEVQEVVAADGWTKDAVGSMHRMDSFFREVHRVYDLNLLHLGRKVMRDFTFSDGTFVPAGSTMFVNSYGAHYDPANYSSPSEFKGFRFVVDDTSIHPRQSQHANGGNEAEKQERQQPQQLLVKPTLNYQPFGYGRLACPGRFTAASQMKLMLAYLLATYDIQTDTDAAPLGFFEKGFRPNMDAKVYFRRRDAAQ